MVEIASGSLWGWDTGAGAGWNGKGLTRAVVWKGGAGFGGGRAAGGRLQDGPCTLRVRT